MCEVGDELPIVRTSKPGVEREVNFNFLLDSSLKIYHSVQNPLVRGAG